MEKQMRKEKQINKKGEGDTATGKKQEKGERHTN